MYLRQLQLHFLFERKNIDMFYYKEDYTLTFQNFLSKYNNILIIRIMRYNKEEIRNS